MNDEKFEHKVVGDERQKQFESVVKRVESDLRLVGLPVFAEGGSTEPYQTYPVRSGRLLRPNGMIESNEHDLLDRYVAYFADVLGRDDPEIHRFAPTSEHGHEILGLVYVDAPHSGYVTGVTLGLSFVHGPENSESRRELCITMRSRDREWGKVPSRLASALQGMHSFEAGKAIGFAGRLADESKMTSVVCFDPALPGLNDRRRFTVDGNGYSAPVIFTGVYPIYSSERDLVYKQGFGALWDLQWDRLDPLRAPVA
jgi:hypothetical protein